MKLTTAVLPHFHYVLTQGRWFTPSVIVLFLGLEMFGRQATSDVHDTVGALVFLLILAGIAIRHRVNPISWVKAIGATTWHIARFADRFKVDMGPDLRGTPPFPRRLPKAVHVVGTILLAWVVLAAVIGGYFPHGWRPLVVPVSYLIYLTMMSVLWGLMFVACLGGVYFPVMLLTRLTDPGQPGDLRLTREQLVFLAGYLVGTTICAWLFPLYVPIAIALGVWLVSAVANFWPVGYSRTQLIWRVPGTRQIYSVPIRRAIFVTASLAVMLLLGLVMTASAGRAFGHPDESTAMPLTTVMGNWLGWLMPGLLLAACGFVFLGWRNDPSRHVRPVLFVAGVAPAERREVARLIRARGWTPIFNRPDMNAVRARLVSPADSQAYEFDPKWPLAVSKDDLAGSFVYDRFERRGEIQFRRLFLRGLGQLLRESKGKSGKGGSGYWLAPHLWFVAGLTRDSIAGSDDEPSFMSEVVGPRYADVFDLPVRRYLYQLLDKSQVDIVFVEDGVKPRSLAKVFRTLFEVVDKNRNQGRAEDQHFLGLAKVRVLFHEFQADEPFRSMNYPEPKFAPLGRLRILHVFRDRGDHEELSDQPFEFDGAPAPDLYLV